MQLKFLWLYVVFIFFKLNVYAQEICVEKIKSKKNTDFFSAAYAIELDSLGYIYLATDNGIFYYNGNTLLKYSKSPYDYIDIISFYKEQNGNIWALPYYGKVFVINNKKRKEIKFFGNNQYKTYYAYTNQQGEIKFYIDYANKSYIGTLYSTGNHSIEENKLGIAAYFTNFIKDKTTNQKQLSIQHDVANYATTQLKIKNDKYFIKENKLFSVENNNLQLVFDGDDYACTQTTIIDCYKSKTNGYYLALMGKKNGLFYFTPQKKLIPIYTHSGVNGVIKDKKGNILFIDKQNKLLKINNIHFTKEKLNIEHDKTINKIVNFPKKDSLIISDNNGSVYFFKTYDSKINKVNICTSQNSYLGRFENQTFYIDENQLHVFYPKEINIPFPKNFKYSIDNIPSKIKHNSQINIILKNNLLQACIQKEKLFLFFKNYVCIYDTTLKSYLQLNYTFKLNFVEPSQDAPLKLHTDKGIYIINDKNLFESSPPHKSNSSNETPILNYGIVNETTYYISPNFIYKNENNSKTIEYKFNKPKSSFDIIDVYAYKDYLIIIGYQGFEIYHTKTKKNYSYTLPYLETNETLIGSLVKDDDIYFYSTEYLYSCPLNFFNPTENNPIVNISSVVFNNQEIEILHKKIEKSYTKKNYLEIKFEVLNAIFNNENKFQYELINLEDNQHAIQKSLINNNQFSINNIKYGKYQVNILYDDQLIKTIHLNYIPKWHQTDSFFISLIILILLSIIYLTYNLILRNFKRKKQIIEEKNYQYRFRKQCNA